MRNIYLPCIRFGHRNYKRWISPLLGEVCRFTPSCSDYALEAIETYGLFRGSWLALKRIIRCNPLCEGGHDPVPPKESPKHKLNTRRCPRETDSNISD